MVDKEFEIGGSVRLPEVYGIPLELGLTVKRSRGERADRLVDRIIELSDFDRETLARRLTADEELREVFLRVLDRTVTVVDEGYADVLGRLVVAALDSARVNEADYLASELIKLEPIHLRVLIQHGFRYLSAVPDEDRFEVVAEPVDGTWPQGAAVHTAQLAGDLGITPGAAASVMQRLAASGLFEARPADPIANPSGKPAVWDSTAWAQQAVMALYPHMSIPGRSAP